MKRIEPSNQACLAVELYAARPRGNVATPFGCARVAAELCSRGRIYKRAAEHVYSYPDPGDRAQRQADRHQAAMLDLLKPWGNRASLEHDGGGLCFNVVTCSKHATAKTWLGAP